MALKPCRECGADISSTAKTCPHCGASNVSQSDKKAVIGCITLPFIAMFALVLYCSSIDTEAECVNGYTAALTSTMLPGERLYYDIGGGQRQFSGTVVQMGYDEGQRAVQVRLSDGSLVWRRMQVITVSDDWSVTCRAN